MASNIRRALLEPARADDAEAVAVAKVDEWIPVRAAAP